MEPENGDGRYFKGHGPHNEAGMKPHIPINQPSNDKQSPDYIRYDGPHPKSGTPYSQVDGSLDNVSYREDGKRGPHFQIEEGYKNALDKFSEYSRRIFQADDDEEFIFTIEKFNEIFSNTFNAVKDAFGNSSSESEVKKACDVLSEIFMQAYNLLMYGYGVQIEYRTDKKKYDDDVKKYEKLSYTDLFNSSYINKQTWEIDFNRLWEEVKKQA